MHGNTPQSRDMNLIEHLWDYLKRKMSERKPSSVKELKTALQEEWDRLPNSFLVSSMLRRLEAVIKAKGGSIKY